MSGSSASSRSARASWPACRSLVFFVTNPYFVLDLDEALDELRSQRFSASEEKLGQDEENPFGFYLSSLTWGLGWGAHRGRLVGAVWEFRRNRTRAILLALFPLLLFLYLGSDAERYFARWLMPAYPILALFAGVAIAGVARSVSKRGAVRVGRSRAADRGDHGPADRRERAHGRRDAEGRHARARAQLHARGAPVGHEDRGRRGRDPAAVRPAAARDRRAGANDPDLHLPASARRRRRTTSIRPTRCAPSASSRTCRRSGSTATARRGYCTVDHDELAARAGRDRRASSRRSPTTTGSSGSRRSLFTADPYDDPDDPVEFDFDGTHLYYDARYDRTGPRVEIRKLDRCENGVRRKA